MYQCIEYIDILWSIILFTKDDVHNLKKYSDFNFDREEKKIKNWCVLYLLLFLSINLVRRKKYYFFNSFLTLHDFLYKVFRVKASFNF